MEDRLLWEDLPSKNTPINATNLNLMQDRILKKVKNEDDLIKTDLSKVSNYTTTEQIVGKWIDGSNLYRKVYQVTTPSVANKDLVVAKADESINSIKELVNMSGYIKYSDGAYMSINNYWQTQDYTSSTYLRTNEGIKLKAGTILTNKPATIVLLYTKKEG